MSNDDAPNATNPEGQPWNPAMRPNPDSPAADASPAPKPSQEPTPGSAENGTVPEPIENPTQEDLDESLAWGDDDEAGGDDFFAGQGSSNGDVGNKNEAAEAAKASSVAEETSGLASSQPKTPPEPSDFPVSNLEQAPNAEPEVTDSKDPHSPAETYEFQGDSTALDTAVQEDATVPLSSDTPGDDWGNTGDSFDIEQDDTVEASKQGDAAEIDWGNDDNGDFSFESAFANAGKAQESANGGANHATTDDLDAAWKAALGDDGLLDENAPVFDDEDGFLDDEPDLPAQPVQQVKPANKYAPPEAAQPPPAAPKNQYTPAGPQFADFSRPQVQQSQTTPYGAAGGYGAYGQPQPQPPRPPAKSAAQSFADKNRGGYSSPYDLPDDLAPRKRPSMPVLQQRASAQAAPPPRSSSVLNPNAPPSRAGPPPSNMSAASLSPPGSSHSVQPPPFQPPGAGSSSQPPSRKSSSGEFFADLPMTRKPRQSSSSSQTSRYAPQPMTQSVPPPAPTPPQRQQTAPAAPAPHQHPLATELRAPEAVDPYAEQPGYQSSPSLAPSAPVQSRYSPAPPAAAGAAPGGRYSPAPSSVPPQASRYSPAPPAAGPPKPPSQPYAPRTSSPLAYHAPPKEQPSSESLGGPAGPAPPGPAQPAAVSAAPPKSGTPPPPRSGSPSAVTSPRKRPQANYTPQYQPTTPPMDSSETFDRPRTQSPGATKKPAPGFQERPRSANGLTSPPPLANATPANTSMPVMRHRRMFSKDLAFIPPQDERQADPLERWKGHPIFNWGLGGTVLTSFPTQNTRYGAGQAIPQIKCGPGDLKIRPAKEIYPLPELVSKFPGPLRTKSKKKEVLTWLKSSIETLESNFRTSVSNHTLAANDQKRAEENLMLWKMMNLFVENDGTLEGNPAIEEAVRKTLAPESHDLTELTSPYVTGANPAGLSQQFPDPARSEPVDAKSFDEIRSYLEKGEREKAVWHAADNRLWAHALLISSTLPNKDIWKQAVQEFVRREIKSGGSGNEPMAALYEVFAGNWEESIDELVPVSARAGFQMVSKSGTGSSRNALEGLEKWRSTLLLILSNRSEGDSQALLSLGKLLAGYGRAEAAHICFLFARSATYFGGADDPNSNVVLMGADHLHNPQLLGQDLEPIILTELYEYGLSLVPNSVSPVLPHLQAYKLQHALSLAEYGHRSEAQSYCDAITNSIKSSTRSSPYYHAHFITQLDDLTKRLSQSPKDSSSFWISKPNMDKVSSNVWSKFSAFVAGDESDAPSDRSTGGDVGPFAKIAGDTPGISPSPSHTDLYGPYGSANASTGPPANPMSSSRYAPTPSYTPHTTRESFSRTRYEPGRPSLDSADGTYASRRSSDNYRPDPTQLPSARSNSYTPANYSPNQSTSPYAPSPAAVPDQTQPAYGSHPYQPTPPPSVPVSGGSGVNPPSAYGPPQAGSEPGPTRGPSIELSPPTTSAGPPTSGYDPLAGSSVEPPSYQPYSADASGEEDAPQESAPKKKSFMDLEDDDDELEKRAAALKAQQKSKADREADDAFRKAAEADAARGAPEKKGWFGGWFGKKDANASPGPIRAKLGEENSFYYDPDLKKWVNKKGGAEDAKPAAATPPPPRGPAPRSTSGGGPGLRPPPGVAQAGVRSSSMPPPSGPGRAATPPRSDSPAPPLPTLSSSVPGAGGPPSRPSTSMSNASSIDDLLGAPAARKGAGKKGKRGRGYVDVMAKD